MGGEKNGGSCRAGGGERGPLTEPLLIRESNLDCLYKQSVRFVFVKQLSSSSKEATEG